MTIPPHLSNRSLCVADQDALPAPVRHMRWLKSLVHVCNGRGKRSLFALGLVGLLALLAVPQAALADDQLATFMTPLGSIAEAEMTHMLRVIMITMIAIVPVLIGVPLIVWRYRRGRKGANYRPDWTFSKPLEIAMWGVPIAIICVAAYWLWHETYKYDPYKPLGEDSLEVQVIGLDWKWLFIYPEQGVASVGELVIPVGRPVTLRLTTDTQMQSFIVPALAGQIYAMAGMETQLNFIADRPGSALGQNTQYTGNGFVDQKFVAKAVAESDWDAWIEKAQEAPLQLDAESYSTLGERGSLADARKQLMPEQKEGPLLFSQAQPDLFMHVMHRYHSGKPLANDQQPGSPTFRIGDTND